MDELERKYLALRKLGLELHIPIPEAFWTLEVFDKNGKLLQRHHQRSHSWVRNAYNWMFCQLASKDADDDTFGAGKLSIKDTGGTVQYGDFVIGQIIDTPLDTSTFGYRADGGEDTWGILVGSGTNAESFEDHVLQTQLTEGTGAGQISHVASEAHSITYTPATKVLKNDLIRYFNNNTGGDRSINEVALVGKIYVKGVLTQTLAARDKLASTVTVPNTGQLKVTYTIQLTYPS